MAGVLVLDFKLRAPFSIFGFGTHPLRLAWRKASSKHAILFVACISGPHRGVRDIRAVSHRDEAASHRNLCIDGGDHGEGEGDGDLHHGKCDGEKNLGQFEECLKGVGIWC